MSIEEVTLDKRLSMLCCKELTLVLRAARSELISSWRSAISESDFARVLGGATTGGMSAKPVEKKEKTVRSYVKLKGEAEASDEDKI